MLDWRENEKGNWMADTPSGTQLVVFKRGERWSWSATRKYQDRPKWSEDEYGDAGEAKQFLENRTAGPEQAVIPERPIDYFEYVHTDI